jgi:branched-chain amino acid aminotransferase
MSKGFAYVEGRYCPVDDARVPVLDPGFTHGDAVYDVVSIWASRFFRLDDHVGRFLNSCAGFRIPCAYDVESLKSILATCAIRGGVTDRAYCALVLTRGSYSAEGERTRDIFTTTPRLIAYAVPYAWISTPEQQQTGLHLIVAKTPRIPSECVDARFKNYHWGDLTQGRFEAQAVGADLAVHLSIGGFLTEGAGFNLFFVKNGRLHTPRLNILLGITRQSIIELAAEADIGVEVGEYGAEALRSADECFITSTAGGVMPVNRIDGRMLCAGSPGPITTRLRDEYWRRRESGWRGTPVASLPPHQTSRAMSHAR